MLMNIHQLQTAVYRGEYDSPEDCFWWNKTWTRL